MTIKFFHSRAMQTRTYCNINIIENSIFRTFILVKYIDIIYNVFLFYNISFYFVFDGGALAIPRKYITPANPH